MSRRAQILGALLGAVIVSLGFWWAWPQRVETSPLSVAGRATASYTLEKAFDDLRFQRPLWMEQEAGGRWLLLEQGGRVHAFDDRRDARPALVIDISDEVRTDHSEEGLLAMALHPEYATNERLFLYYSRSSPVRSVVEEHGPGGRRMILEVTQPYGNHNGGTLLFGPDGYLYLSLGDGGAGGDPHGNAQDLGTLLGSILRIDVDAPGVPYAIPPDNPFVGREGARPEIWAWGLRNVWRMSFDRETGRLWAADVGQDAWEEVDVIVEGGNYGWPWREGAHRYGRRRAPAELALIDPVHDYGHDLGRSITGGYVYRGSRLPELQGRYVFADFVTGRVWALAGENHEAEILVASGYTNIASFAEARDGRLFIIAFDGKIYRLAAR